MMYLIGFSITDVKDKAQSENLENMLITLLTWGYDIITLDEFQNRVGYGNFASKATTFVFPFGYKSIMENVFPVFNRYKIPFSVTLSSDYVGDKSRWEKQQKDIVSLEDLSKLKASKQVSFLSSGTSYKNLAQLQETHAHEELEKSKLFIEKFTSSEVHYFVWPYNKVPQNAQVLLKKNHYFAGFSASKKCLKLPFTTMECIPLYPFASPPGTLRLFLTVRYQETQKNK